MATYFPPKVSTQFIYFGGLVQQSSTLVLKSNPTIASGDFKVSIDGAALANLGTLPTVTPASSVMVKYTLSTSEMAGANATVVSIDASGAEWCDKLDNFQTTARQIDDLCFPTTSGRSLDVTTTGEAGIDWANVGAPTTSLALTGTTIAVTQKVDVDTIKTNPVVNAGTITFPTTATLASTTNITAGTITTVTTTTTATNLTNAPTAGDFTATMKTSIGTAVAASAVSSVTGNVGGNVTGSVGSVVGAVGSVTGAVGSVTGAVGSVTGAVGSVTGNVGGNVTGSVGSIASNGITDASYAAGTGKKVIRASTATAGSGTTITLDGSASAVDSFYNNGLIYLTGGTGAGQARFISAYVGATKVATVGAWVTNPDNTTTFAILPFDAVAGATAPTVQQIVDGTWNELRSAHVAAGSMGEAMANIDTPIQDAVWMSLKSAYLDPLTLGGAVSAIVGKTNSLTFTVAGEVDSNVQAVNDVTLKGDGAGTPWGPV